MKLTVLTTAILAISSFSVTADDSVAGKSQHGSAYTGHEVNVPDSNTPAQPNERRETKAVSYSFAIDDIQKIDFSQKQAHVQSRQFKLDVTGAQLKRGVRFNTSAKGALVRISAFDGKSAVEPENLTLKTRSGQFKATKAFDTLVNSNAMRKTGMGFQEGTTGFKLSDKVGMGQFTLKADKGVNVGSQYRINVFEKNSDTELYLTANKNHYLADETLTVNAKVFDLGNIQKINDIKAQLVSPEGKRFDVQLQRSKEGYRLSKSLDMPAQTIPGALWELHTQTKVMVNGTLIQRNGQLPFAFAEKTAKLSASATMFGQKQSPKASVPISVKTDGRYEVRAILYGTDASGNLKPAMMTHSAANLAAGEGAIIIDFDSNILQKSGLSAPFEVRNVELRDQSKMALIDEM